MTMMAGKAMREPKLACFLHMQGVHIALAWPQPARIGRID